jgi:DNA (cytosine-5)-methyltransferase 1
MSEYLYPCVNELALFAGAGGGILGGHLLGWRCVCAVEYNAYARSVLLARQNDGTLPPFPIWDDVRTFDGRPWRGVVDVVSGGFPCQDISAAGKGAGLDGERSGLWREMARIVGEVRPRFVFVENSPVLTSRGLGTVLADLAALGFDARWRVLESAARSWATPRAADITGAGRAPSLQGGDNLRTQAKNWGTPTTRDYKDSGDCSNVPENGLLGRMAKSWSGMTAQPGSLSPEFHLWLMGWPAGWTALEPVAMDKYQLWLQQHGACSAAPESLAA